MTMAQMYWLVMLDSIKSVAGVMAVMSLLFTIAGAGICANTDLEGNMRRFWLLPILSGVLFVSMMLVLAFLPGTSQMATILEIKPQELKEKTER